MVVTRVLVATAGVALALAVAGFTPHDASAQEENSGGVNPASEQIAASAPVQAAWGSGGLTFKADPDMGPAAAGAGGASRARVPWVINVYDYAGEQQLLTLRLNGLGNQPSRRAAKAITQAVAFLQQRSGKPGAEVRLSFHTGVVVRARSHE